MPGPATSIIESPMSTTRSGSARVIAWPTAIGTLPTSAARAADGHRAGA